VSAYILDASVAAKWFLPHDEAGRNPWRNPQRVADLLGGVFVRRRSNGLPLRVTQMKHVYGFEWGIGPKDDAVRVKKKLPKFPFQVLTLPREWTAPRKTLQRIDLPVQRPKPPGAFEGARS